MNDDPLRYVFAKMIACPRCGCTKYRSSNSVAEKSTKVGIDGREFEIELRRQARGKCKNCCHKFWIIFEP